MKENFSGSRLPAETIAFGERVSQPITGIAPERVMHYLANTDPVALVAQYWSAYLLFRAGIYGVSKVHEIWREKNKKQQ